MSITHTRAEIVSLAKSFNPDAKLDVLDALIGEHGLDETYRIVAGASFTRSKANATGRREALLKRAQAVGVPESAIVILCDRFGEDAVEGVLAQKEREKGLKSAAVAYGTKAQPARDPNAALKRFFGTEEG